MLRTGLEVDLEGRHIDQVGAQVAHRIDLEVDLEEALGSSLAEVLEVADDIGREAVPEVLLYIILTAVSNQKVAISNQTVDWAPT